MPVFRTLNVVITAVWAVCFTVTAIALAIAGVTGVSIAVAAAIQVFGFAIPAVFTARYPQIVQARAMRAAGAVLTTQEVSA